MRDERLASYVPVRVGEFAFPLTDKVIFGRGTLERLPDEVRRLGRTRAFVLTGNSIATMTPLLAQVRDLLGDAFAGAFTDCRQHVPSLTVLAAARAAEAAQADLLIGLGGGSPIDLARGVARMLAHEAVPSSVPADQFFAYLAQPMVRSPLPNIAISTTLSAADFSFGGGITDEVTHTKLVGWSDPSLTSRVILLAPEVTLFTPIALWAASGIRAVDHAVESLYSKRPHPVTDLLATRALALLFSYLPRSVEHPNDLEIREQCQLGCWLSFFSPPSVMLGPSHALGHQLGSRCDVPHGVTSCILLPRVMRQLAPDLAERMVPMAAAMGVDCTGKSALDAAIAAADAVTTLVHRLGLPSHLREVGVQQSDLRPIAEAAFAERGVQGTAHPVSGPAELEAILQQAW